MSRGKSGRNDRSNLEKMKREMRRKKEKAESLAGGAAESPAPTEPPELSAQPALPVASETPAQLTPPAAAEPSVQSAPSFAVNAAATAGSAAVGDGFAAADNGALASEGDRGTAASDAETAAADSAAGVPLEREASAGAAPDRKLDLVIFQTGAEKFAFRLTQVREIVRVEGPRSVPGAPAHVVGLRNLRGEILPVIDIRRCFRMPPRAYDDDSRMIVAEVHGRPAGIITDRISEVATVDISDVMEPPANIRRINEGCVTGIVARGRDLIMVLDAEKLPGILLADHATGLADARSGRNEARDARRGLSREMVVFQVGRENYALNIGHVQEILRCGELLRVPNAHPCVAGVMTVRNRLLAVINPGQIFGLRDHRVHESARIVVVRAEELTYGIVVDHVSEVARVPEDRFHKPVRIVDDGEADFVSDMVELTRGREMAMVLDPRKLAAFADLGELYAGIGQSRHGIGAAEHGDSFSREQAHREKIVIFRVGGGTYGVGMDRVREINNPDRIVGIPGTPDFVPGMANLRGDLIPLVDMRVLFGFAGHAAPASAKFLVVEHNGQRAGLLVDAVSDVIDVDRGQFEPVSRLAEAEGRKQYVDRFCKLDEGRTTVLMVNLDTALDGVI